MKSNKLRLSLITIGAILATWLIFQLFFYLTSLGYVSIGDSYCKFGPIPAKYASFNVAFKSNYTGQLTLVDKKERQLPNADYTVYVEGRKVGTSFKAPGKSLINIKIRGNSSKVTGRTFVRVKGGGPYITHYYFRHHSNPFVYYLIFLITAIIFVAVLWFVFLQKQFYPRFRAIRKTIVVPNQAQISIQFRNARMIVIDNQMHKQPWFDRLVKGPIVYKTNPGIKSQIKLVPRNNGHQILFINKGYYYCSPNPIGLTPSSVTNNMSNEVIEIF